MEIEIYYINKIFNNIKMTNIFKEGRGNGICNNRSKFIAVGSSKDSSITIAYSFDGIKWKETENNIFQGGSGFKVCCNHTIFVALGYNRDNTVTIGYSVNGIHWTPCEHNIFEGGYGIAICWNEIKFIACGLINGDELIFVESLDGINWEYIPDNIFNGGHVLDIYWDGSKFFVVGNNNDTMSIAHSLDGIRWTPISNIFEGGFGRGICWNNITYVAVGENRDSTITIAYSTDGIIWNASESNIFEGGYGTGVCWGNSIFVAIGYNSRHTISIAYSVNGIKWTPCEHNIFEGGFGTGICWDGTKFVAVGNDEDYNVSIAYSYDGIKWESTSKMTIVDTILINNIDEVIFDKTHDIDERNITFNTCTDFITDENDKKITEHLNDIDTFLFINKESYKDIFDIFCFEKSYIENIINNQEDNWFYECNGDFTMDKPLDKVLDSYIDFPYIKIPINTNGSNGFIPLSELLKLLTSYEKIYYIYPFLVDRVQKMITHTASWKNIGDGQRNPDHIGANHCQYGSNILVYTLKLCRDQEKCIKSIIFNKPFSVDIEDEII